ENQITWLNETDSSCASEQAVLKKGSSYDLSGLKSRFNLSFSIDEDFGSVFELTENELSVLASIALELQTTRDCAETCSYSVSLVSRNTCEAD
ncbi:MAG: hypothetical protein V1834_03350, partial [Candidatus Micrarchaeota archaeon]